MSNLERQERISKNLGIRPISHGQIYTLQIAIPDSEKRDISAERQKVLKNSFNQHKSNLIPLIVRRTEAYNEDEEYEVVYGADWWIVAKELNIEKLWVWVFEMNDEQAQAAKVQMEQLTNQTIKPFNETSTKNIGNNLQKIEQLYKKEIEIHQKKINQSFKQLETAFNEQIESIYREFNLKREEPKQDYSSMTVTQLKALVKAKNIQVPGKARKNDLVLALKKNEQN